MKLDRLTRVLGALMIAAAGMAGAATANAEDITVYTALEDDQLAAYKEAFEGANPDITINWVRDSTGVITSRLLAEKDNPQADVIWGLAATSLLVLDAEGMLEGYAPVGVEANDVLDVLRHELPEIEPQRLQPGLGKRRDGKSQTRLSRSDSALGSEL